MCDAMEGGSMVVNVVEGDDGALIGGLPPGFRFHPTDEEIITHYLTPKVTDRSFTAAAIGEVDLNKCEPWDLHEKAKMGEKEWFFFCQRDRKYPTGMRTNRATDSGYWKATGKDKSILKKGNSGGGSGDGGGKLVGMKKTLVFYKGRAPKGQKTNWVMHEFRLEGDFSYYNMARPPKDEWVVCRIVQKNTEIMRNTSTNHGMTRTNSSFVKELLESPSWLPPLMESPPPPRFDPNIPGSSFTHSYFSHDHQPQKDQDYKNFIVSPYNNFDTNSLLMNPFTNDLQSDFPSTLASSSSTNFPYLSSGSPRYYMDRASMLDGDQAQKDAGQCKVEPFNAYQSSKISVSTSQDTGISNDTATYTSSASIHDIYAYNAL